MTWTRYYSAATLNDALTLLAQNVGRARIIAGGTDLLIELERHQRPGVETLIDISRVPGLDHITLADGRFTLGPLVTHNDVVAHAGLRQYALPLAQAAWEVGAPQIRNRGTIAGNVITGSPANDTIAPLLALDAAVTLTSSAEGMRTVTLADFYSGLRRTVMRPDEILTAIHIPAMRETQRGAFLKLGLRRAQAISVVNIAVVLTFEGETVSEAALAYGSVAPTVVRVAEAERVLIGQPLTEQRMVEAAHAAAAALKPIDDIRSTAAYRSEMVKVLTVRALRQLGRDTLPQRPVMLWGARSRPPLTHTILHENGSVDGQTIDTLVNGQRLRVPTGQGKTLLRWLREDIGLVGTKEGCAEGECGACTVFLDGAAVMACMVPAPRGHGAEIVTVEGLAAERDGTLHPIQQAFIEEGAVQCGYCTPGFLMSGAKLLEEHPQPTQAQIQQSISGNLCRCTGYYKIVSAFIKASETGQTEEGKAAL